MFQASFIIDRLMPVGVLVLAALVGSPANAAPPVATASIPQAPTAQSYSAAERLARIDALHAELQEAKLRAEIAKAKAEASGTPTIPGTNAGLTPPLPPTGAVLPPLPADGFVGVSRHAHRRPVSHWPGLAVTEVTGTTDAPRAIVQTAAGGARLVQIGSVIEGVKVVAIRADGLTVADAGGKTHTYN